MKNNETLQKEVQDAIKWEPLLHAAEIGVTVKDGVVTLTGTVDSYTKKLEAEHATKRVKGVLAVVEKIEIIFSSSVKTTDSEIANEVLNSFKWDWQIPNDKIKVKVEGGWVTLEGEVNWNFQRKATKNSVVNLIGVKGVTNNIKLKSETHDTIEKSAIERALSRNWALHNCDIAVAVSGNKVTLTGAVNSWYEKDEAERIAFNAPGVWFVDNELAIEYNYALID